MDMTTTAPKTKKNVDWTSIDTSIEYVGRKITLPGEPGQMPLDAAIATLERIKADEAQEYDVSEAVNGAPWDALVAVYRAIQNIYGVVSPTTTPGFFGPILPDMVSVKTGPRSTDVIQVPMGAMQIPHVANKVHAHIWTGGATITGRVNKSGRAILVEIAVEARRIMKTESVYKSKAIRLGVDENGDLILHQQPEFLDLSGVQVSDAIHTAETEALIRTNILAPLMQTENCRRHKIPLKRGILLEGRYGTGKSLTARVTAKVATDHGWTFIMLDRAQGLKTAIEFARTYQPCVIFAEDIDRASDRTDEGVNDLVNLLDGLISKDMEMMVVLTTNFVEKIDRALLRPGRFDAVIPIQAPDRPTVERLLRAYGRDLLPADVDLSTASDVLNGQIPATIREVVERSKLAMLVDGRATLSAEDITVSAIGMRRHLDLLEPKVETDTREGRLWKALTELVSASASALTDDQDVTLDNIERDAGMASAAAQRVETRIVNQVNPKLEKALSAAGAASEAARTAAEIAAIARKEANSYGQHISGEIKEVKKAVASR